MEPAAKDNRTPKQRAAYDRLGRLFYGLATHAREWNAARPEMEALPIGAHEVWRAINELLTYTVMSGTDGRWQVLIEAAQSFRAAFEREEAREDARRRGCLRAENVNRQARRASELAAESLRSGKDPTEDIVVSISLLVLPMPERFPLGETTHDITAAVRRRLQSFAKKETAWTPEDKARSLVRAALAAIGWRRDPFVAERVKRHRQNRRG